MNGCVYGAGGDQRSRKTSDADSESEPLMKLAYAQIEDVFVDSLGVSRRVVIKRANGGFDSFDCGRVRTDPKMTQSAGDLIKSRWQSAHTK